MRCILLIFFQISLFVTFQAMFFKHFTIKHSLILFKSFFQLLLPISTNLFNSFSTLCNVLGYVNIPRKLQKSMNISLLLGHLLSKCDHMSIHKDMPNPEHTTIVTVFWLVSYIPKHSWQIQFFFQLFRFQVICNIMTLFNTL